jgi:hypothetical protein
MLADLTARLSILLSLLFAPGPFTLSVLNNHSYLRRCMLISIARLHV